MQPLKITEDIRLLLTPGIIGNYNQCSVVEIFGMEGKEVFNIFASVPLKKADM